MGGADCSSLAKCLTAKAQRNDHETETLIPMRRGGFFDDPHQPTTLAIRGRAEGSSLEARADGTANTILTPSGGRAGIGVGAIHYQMSVRRLTPTECERLQGFRDGFTAIPWKNKPAEKCPDGPRYKALGNSMAVPVMAWIGKRIAAQNAITPTIEIDYE